ncbi:MAG: VWA domain-containing protein [Desulfobulbus sp.]|nr:VWA domain-containing protein [Desulfobulbus sp.]
MELEILKEKFYRLVAPSLPNEWDVEEALAGLTLDDAQQIEEIFAQIPAIWPVSHSLCFSYLSAAGPAVACLAPEELSLWVHGLLDCYETKGLRGAQLFMADVAEHFLRQIRGQGGLRLADIRPRLQTYVNGLAGRELTLVAAEAAATDGESIFLPAEVGVYEDQEHNFLVYKLIASFQWACLHAGVFDPPPGFAPGKKKAHPLERYFSTFARPEQARSLFHFFETARVLAVLRQELPGLMRQAEPLLGRLVPPADDDRDPTLLDQLQQGLLRDEWPEPGQDGRFDRARRLLDACRRQTADHQPSLEAVQALLPEVEAEEDLTRTAPLLFQGTLLLQEMRNLGLQQQTSRELRMMQSLTVKLHAGPRSPENGDEEERRGGSGQQGQDRALIVDTPPEWPHGPPPWEPMHVDNPAVEEGSPPDASEQQRVNTVAEETSSAAAGRAGRMFATGGGAPQEGEAAWQEPVVYDEWDYRRKGFRKNWCVLQEKEIERVQTRFIEQTLGQYRGHIRRLRHQFEMMRTTERFVRRQRDGNDIDLDAMVESLADSQAGLAPSDRLFVRLERDERDIAVHFLVDMSNSTAGWVGKSIKEALVLICEAMEMLNDRYGIYGFSGMRRLRCEIFPVKRLDERYSAAVRERISAIGPREYTRMAPAIRHMTSLFARVEAKVRLLIILSDGKPEDYDDYKGEYAIEDTRHALLEAKARGIHPFCITIDRQAHEYMAHMYGEVNSIFIDQIDRLPARMPEIYRALTS